MSDFDFAKIFKGLPSSVKIHYVDSKKVGEDTDEGPAPEKFWIVLGVSKPGWGFGEFTIIQDETGQVYLDTERSYLETVKEALCQLVDSAITDWDKDPVKHAQYNLARRSTCGGGCEMCFPKENG